MIILRKRHKRKEKKLDRRPSDVLRVFRWRDNQEPGGIGVTVEGHDVIGDFSVRFETDA